MTDNIARWASEAGWWTLSRILRVRLERFAAQVAAEEREACAQICADYTEWGREWGQDCNHMAAEAAANECAAAIRARGVVK